MTTVPVTLFFTPDEDSRLSAAASYRCIDKESLIREASYREAQRLDPLALLPALVLTVVAPILFRQPAAVASAP